MIQLHLSPSSAAMAPHFLLEELGLPFEIVLVDTSQQAHKRPEYLKLNPNGLVPTLVDGELVLYETPAILMHLCDQADRLLPPLRSAARAQAYKWMAWLNNSVQTALIAYFYPQRWSAHHPDEVKAAAQARVLELLEQLDAQLAAHCQDWLLGSEFSAIDCLAFTLCRWTRNFDGRKARDFTHIGPYLQRLMARPALQRVFQREGLSAPFC